jgi:predicted O-linked N-acetylglucosamine transferase (SPINDLY family)
MLDEQRMLRRAFALHRGGDNAGAAKLYRRLIDRNRMHPHALHSLALIEADAGNVARAKSLMERSLASGPPNLPFVENYATLLFRTGDADACVRACEQGLRIDAGSAALLFLGAACLARLARLPESLAWLDRLLARHPDHAAALNERGSVLALLGRHDDAMASFERSLARDPRQPEPHVNTGNIHVAAGRHAAALACYEQAIAARADFAVAWLGRGNCLAELGRRDEAIAALDRAIELRPDLAEAWLGRGNLLRALNRQGEAFAAYEKALALKPDLVAAGIGCGSVMMDILRHDDALAFYDKAIAIKPDHADAWFARGTLRFLQKNYDGAQADFAAALRLQPNSSEHHAAWLRTRMHLCEWSNHDAECARLTASVRDGATVVPFIFLAVPSSPDDQLACARTWTARKFPPSSRPAWRAERYAHDRIRVGYLSADFYQHATSFLMAGVFEHHDRSRFETIGICIGANDGSALRRRIEASFDRFLDVESERDARIAEIVREIEIDILVDLKGFTLDARTNILAQRAAPIQVSYLGYPGSMGADYVDYIIADRIVIPHDHRPSYAEKIAYLPNSYQANDATRPIADRQFARSEFGLPPDGFVFCCFNDNYKIAPDVFDLWMMILAGTPKSVLWLLEDNPTAAANLKRAAGARGIAPERLVFARRLTTPEHLARHRCADLFLDTLPYNAHTTASDALWAGLPVLTRIGDTFAGRVAASLLTALGLAELITTSADAYVARAVALASDPAALAALQQRLARNRATMPLFDTALFTRHLEAAYAAMHARHHAGLPPDDIQVE